MRRFSVSCFFLILVLLCSITSQGQTTTWFHAPGGDFSKAHRDEIINYITWDNTKWTAKVQEGIFIHAPNGDFSRAHKDNIINYITWDNTRWTAKLQ